MRVMGMIGSDMQANIGPEMHNLLVRSTEEVLFPSAGAADRDVFSRAPSTLPMDSESDVSQKMHMLDTTTAGYWQVTKLLGLTLRWQFFF